jgi:hypothetical protein
MNKIVISVCAAVLVCAAPFRARANTILTGAGAGNEGFSMIPGSNFLGYQFTVGSTPLMITALGLWDGPTFTVDVGFTGVIGDGFVDQHVVELKDTFGNVLATANMQIGTGDALMGEFRYAATLIPTNPGSVILSANTAYILQASYVQEDPDSFRVNSGSQQAAVFDPAVSGNTGSLATVGPNAIFSLVTNGVPESGSTVVMMGIALGGLMALRRLLASLA